MEARVNFGRIGIAAGLAALIAPLFAAPAFALSKTARCETSGFVGRAWTNYHISGNFDVIDFFEFGQIGAGSKSDVVIRQRHSRTGEDAIDFGPETVGSLVSNQYKTYTPETTVRIHVSFDTYTNYHFIFDRSGTDPKCDAETVKW
jgi:hypothetical protein